MIPLKDNIPTDRVPVVTFLLVAANVTGSFFVSGGGILSLLATVVFLWIFGTNVEDAMSRARFAIFCLLGGGLAAGVLRLMDPGATAGVVAAAGATAAVLGGYILLYPRARIVSVIPVPFAFTMVEAPAWGLVGAWFAIQAIFAATSIGGSAAHGAAAFVAQAGAFAFGVLAVRLFAQRRKPVPPPLSAIPLSS